MKNASSQKTKPETPKTPGGISKSLLTPCRRVGLSRNWKKSLASPFNSPLAGTEAKQDNEESRKRKECLEETPQKTETGCEEPENVGTPSRKVDLPRRKKSKTLLRSITEPTPEETEERRMENDKAEVPKVSTPEHLKPKSKESAKEDKAVNIELEVSTPVCLDSKSKSKKKMSPKNINKRSTSITVIKKENVESNIKLIESKSSEKTEKTDTVKEIPDNIQIGKKVTSPNNLTRECIVVIQKKIFKDQLKENKTANDITDEPKQTSQALFNDSDSDDVPLKCLNRTEKNVQTITIDEDDDFATNKPKLKKTSSNKSKEKPAIKTSKESKKTLVNIHNPPPQSSIDEEDDFFEKRTILVRKTYDKVIKPLKAKSTGSITQKDIEDLKARIETKKKMLLAKSMTDTKELRELIKKWQKGCQDALMELMDLMKNKCPDQSMEYPQILQTLKIPANLVGYDSDNDCFVTPDDENIISYHLKE